MNKIRLVQPIINHTIHQTMDAFSFDEKKGHVLIQRICFWFLNKIKAYYPQVQINTTYEIVDIDTNKAFDTLLKQLEISQIITKELSSRCNNYTLLIGAKTHSELICDTRVRGLVQYELNGEIRRYCNLQIFNIKIVVKVIPWIDGMVLLPDNI